MVCHYGPGFIGDIRSNGFSITIKEYEDVFPGVPAGIFFKLIADQAGYFVIEENELLLQLCSIPESESGVLFSQGN